MKGLVKWRDALTVARRRVPRGTLRAALLLVVLVTAAVADGTPLGVAIRDALIALASYAL